MSDNPDSRLLNAMAVQLEALGDEVKELRDQVDFLSRRQAAMHRCADCFGFFATEADYQQHRCTT